MMVVAPVWCGCGMAAMPAIAMMVRVEEVVGW